MNIFRLLVHIVAVSSKRVTVAVVAEIRLFVNVKLRVFDKFLFHLSGCLFVLSLMSARYSCTRD